MDGIAQLFCLCPLLTYSVSCLLFVDIQFKVGLCGYNCEDYNLSEMNITMGCFNPIP